MQKRDRVLREDSTFEPVAEVLGTCGVRNGRYYPTGRFNADVIEGKHTKLEILCQPLHQRKFSTAGMDGHGKRSAKHGHLRKQY